MSSPAVEPLRLGQLDGDGIGPEIVPWVRRAVDAALAGADRSATWLDLPVGLAAIGPTGSAIPDATIEALEGCDGWVLGPHDNASYPEPHRSELNPSGRLRIDFDLYSNLRPARRLPGTEPLTPDLDVLVVRENTQGFYADRNLWQGSGEFMPTPDTAMSLSVFTRPAIERIARVACQHAVARRGQLTIAHKANVLQQTSGMFLAVCREVAAEYPDVRVDDHHIDALVAHVVRRPADFDVIVAENMFGDILSDLTGELAGSLGTAASINHSDTRVMAQATHGAAPDIAGTGQANPTALLLSAAMMLDWLAAKRAEDALGVAASRIAGAVEDVLAGGRATPDLGGTASTAEFGEAVIAAIARPVPSL